MKINAHISVYEIFFGVNQVNPFQKLVKDSKEVMSCTDLCIKDTLGPAKIILIVKVS